jgi:hypothetical protein
MSKYSFVFVACVTVCAMGCGRRSLPLPETYPVHGTVAFQNGKPVTSGIVQFESATNHSVTTTAVIQQDGSYSLTTSRGRVRAEGALPGPNRVIVTLSAGSGRKGGGENIIVLPTMYDVQPRNNEFALVVGN